MKITKRIVALSLALATCLSLAACGKTGSTSTSKSNPGSTSTSKSEAKKTWDLPDDLTLTIGIPGKTNVLDWENNAFTKWLEAETGYDLKFELYASTDADAKSQLVSQLTGGEKLPDILLNFNIWVEERDPYGDDGYFVDLAEYLFDEDYMEQFCEYDFWGNYTKNVTGPVRECVDATIMSYDGKLYSFPQIQSGWWDTTSGSAWINQTWLDKLGLKMPTNMDELYAVCQEFITKDPNGNGQPDEIGMLGRHAGTFHWSAPDWIINHYASAHWFYSIENATGNFVMTKTTDEYREGLKAVRKFVDAGILSPLNWTISSSELYALTSPADGVAKIGVIFGQPTNWDKEATSVFDQYTYLAPFGGYCEVRANTYRVSRNYVTTDCKYPEAAIDLLLTIASPEGIRRQRYGEEGVDWVWGKDATTGEDIIVIQNNDAYSGQTKQTWGQETVKVSWTVAEGEDWKDPAPCITGITNTPENQTHAEKRTLKQRAAAAEYIAVRNQFAEDYSDKKYTPYFMNVAPMTAEEAAASVGPETQAMSYIKNTVNAFSNGELDINDDAEWAKYQQTIKDMGCEEGNLKMNRISYERAIKNAATFVAKAEAMAGIYNKG